MVSAFTVNSHPLASSVIFSTDRLFDRDLNFGIATAKAIRTAIEIAARNAKSAEAGLICPNRCGDCYTTARAIAKR